MLVHLAQEGRAQPVLVEEAEGAGSPVVARRVVGAAGEPARRRSVGDDVGLVVGGEVDELGEPAGDDRSDVVGVLRHPEEGVALAELEVLVPATLTTSDRPRWWIGNGTGPRAW